LLAAATLLADASASADDGDTTDALPGVVRVPVLSPSARGPAVATSGGYGYTESVLGKGDAYSRASGSLAVSYQPVSYFAAALRFDGRYDVDTGAPAAHGYTGDPRLELRGMIPVGTGLRLGGQVGVWAPGGVAPSFPVRAITPDVSVIATYAPPESDFTFTSRLGFRWDNSSESVSNIAEVPLPDRVELGLNQASAILTGLGTTYRVTPRVELLADLTWDLLVGSAAPSVGDAPILASAGVRGTLDADGKLQVLGVVTASPSGRPTVTEAAPLVDIEPRVSLLVGLVLRPFAKRAVLPGAVTAPAGPAPAPEVVATHGRLKGRAMTEDGVTPLVHARVVVTPRGGGEKQETETDEQGRFETGDMAVGEASVEITAPGWKPITKTVTISGSPQPLDVAAARALPAGEVRGVVRDFGGKPVKGTVRIDPGGVTAVIGADGRFRAEVQPGAYDVVIHSPGYVDQTRHVTVERDAVVLLNVELRGQTR
jgi:hypothetical protein